MEDNSDTSHLKYHFMVKNLEVSEDFKQKLIQELETQVGPVQYEYIRIRTNSSGKTQVLFGLQKDADAVRLLRRRVTISIPQNPRAKIEPTDVFKAYLDYNSNKKLAKKPERQRERQRQRDRSPQPRASPILLVLFPPRSLKNSDILESLKEFQIEESPKIEQIFTNMPGIKSQQIVKLTFRHLHTVEYLTKQQMYLNGQPVMLLEPSLQHDLEKSVMHAIPHHQVNVVSSVDVPDTELRNALERFGALVQIEGDSPDFVVTFGQLRSAKEALKVGSFSDAGVSFTITKKRVIQQGLGTDIVIQLMGKVRNWKGVAFCGGDFEKIFR